MNADKQIHTVSFDVASTTNPFSVMPFAFAPDTDGGTPEVAPDAFLGTGEVHRLRFDPVLPAGSTVRVLDYVDNQGVPLIGGSSTPDPDLGHGQFPVLSERAIELDPGSTGRATTVAQKTGSSDTVGTHVLTLNDTPLASVAYGDLALALQQGVLQEWEGRVACPGGIVVEVTPGGAWAGQVHVDVDLFDVGRLYYKRFQNRSRTRRSYAISSVVVGNPTEIHFASTEQVVPVGGTYDAYIDGLDDAFDGLWPGLVAVALSGGDFIVNLPVTSTGSYVAAGNVHIVYPKGYPSGNQ